MTVGFWLFLLFWFWSGFVIFFSLTEKLFNIVFEPCLKYAEDDLQDIYQSLDLVNVDPVVVMLHCKENIVRE